MPRVSVIMGVYNTLKTEYLLAAVNSILAQSFTDFEFIICDDGCHKDIRETLSQLKEKDSRIKVIVNEQNKGLANSLNRCIMEAQGEFIARQDDDDLSDPDRLKKQVDFLDQNHDYSIIGTLIKLFDDSGEWGIRKIKEFPQRQDFLWGSQFFHPTVLMKKDDLIKVGLYRAAKETRRAEDFDLFARMYAAGMRGCNIQEALYLYREDDNAYLKRKYRYRIDEAKLKYQCYKLLGLMPKGYLYILKPLIIGLIPKKLMISYRKMKDGRK